MKGSIITYMQRKRMTKDQIKKIIGKNREIF